MNNKAIVTLVLGEKYIGIWKKYAYPGWLNYANRHGYDLIVHSIPLDISDRATKRSPAWQKCLILNQEISKYERVVWIDADILINPISPSIVDIVPYDKIGGTNSYSFYSAELYSLIYEESIMGSESNGIWGKSGKEFYNNWGIDTNMNDVIQTGVLVLNPKLHKEVLEYTYYHYDEKGGLEWHYEMRPLSFEIVKNNLHHFIDHRFNFIFLNFLILNYPFMESIKNDKSLIRKLLRRILLLGNKNTLTQLAATTAYSNSYFLHFGGCKDYMAVVNQKIIHRSDFCNLQLRHTDFLLID